MLHPNPVHSKMNLQVCIMYLFCIDATHTCSVTAKYMFVHFIVSTYSFCTFPGWSSDCLAVLYPVALVHYLSLITNEPFPRCQESLFLSFSEFLSFSLPQSSFCGWCSPSPGTDLVPPEKPGLHWPFALRPPKLSETQSAC